MKHGNQNHEDRVNSKHREIFRGFKELYRNGQEDKDFIKFSAQWAAVEILEGRSYRIEKEKRFGVSLRTRMFGGNAKHFCTEEVTSYIAEILGKDSVEALNDLVRSGGSFNNCGNGDRG